MAIADNHNLIHYSSALEAEIVSQTPGRVRLRLTPRHRQRQKIIPLVKALQARLEIYRVRTNIPTGSITILHGRELLSSQDLLLILQDLGVSLVEITREPRGSIYSSASAAAVIKTATGLNQQVKTATNEAIDLRFLFPLSLGVLAMRQLIVKGWQLELIPWYVLAWYAFDSFIKLNSIDEQ